MKAFFKRYWVLTLIDFLFWVMLITSPGNFSFLYNFALSTILLLLILLIEYGIYRLLVKLRVVKSPQPVVHKKYSAVAPISDDLIQHYQNQGLTDDEIRLFRETMKTTRDQIMFLEDFFSHSDLTYIDEQTNVILACQSIFKELVSEPRKLNIANDFLYQHLPNLYELAKKYMEVARRNQISQDATALLAQTKTTIENLSRLIVDDYKQLTQDDIQALTDEINLANRQIKQKEGTRNE